MTLAHMLLAVAPVHHGVINTDGVEIKPIEVNGVLGRVLGEAHVLLNGRTMNVAGVLGQVIGAVNLLDKDGVAVQGVLGSVIGAADITVAAGSNTEDGIPTEGYFNTEDGLNLLPYVSSHETQSGSHTDYNLTIPDGEPGDILVAYCAMSSLAGSNLEGTDRWNMLFNSSATIYAHQLFWKVRDGSESGTLDVGFPTSVQRAITLINIKNTAGFQVSAHDQPDGNGNDVSASLTTLLDNTLVVLFSALNDSGTLTISSDFDPPIDSAVAGVSSALSSHLYPTAGAIGTQTVHWSQAVRRSIALFGVSPTIGGPSFVGERHATSDTDTVAVAGMVHSHRYWRFNATANHSGETGINFDRFKFLFEGAEVTNGSMTWTATSTLAGGYDIYHITNPSSAPGWASAYDGVLPVGFMVDAGSPIAVDAIAVKPNYDNAMPPAFSVDYSDNGSTWTTLSSFSGVPGLDHNVEHTFTLDTFLHLGDILLAWVASASDSLPDLTTSGWTVKETGGTIDGGSMTLWTRRADADDVGGTGWTFGNASSGTGVAAIVAAVRGRLSRTNFTTATVAVTTQVVNAGLSYSSGDLALYGIEAQEGAGRDFSGTTEGATLIADVPASATAPAIRVEYAVATAPGEGMLTAIEYSTTSRTARATAIIT